MVANAIEDMIKRLIVDLKEKEVSANDGMMQNAQAMTHSTSSGTEEPHFILSIKQEPERIKIEITNTGSRISRKIQNRIFEPFYTTKPEGIGTGLGLSVSYFIITEIHNGEIKVESDGISWVEFIILLPIS